jgi:hypothetical protein
MINRRLSLELMRLEIADGTLACKPSPLFIPSLNVLYFLVHDSASKNGRKFNTTPVAHNLNTQLRMHQIWMVIFCGGFVHGLMKEARRTVLKI